VSEDLTIDSIEPEAMALLGYDTNQLVGRLLLNVLPPIPEAPNQLQLDTFMEFFSGNNQMLSRRYALAITRTKHIIPLNILGRQKESGWDLYIEDCTSLEALFNFSESGILTQVSERVTSLFGHSAEDCNGQSLNFLIPNFDANEINTMEMNRIPLTGEAKDGTRFPVNLEFMRKKTEEGVHFSGRVTHASMNHIKMLPSILRLIRKANGGLTSSGFSLDESKVSLVDNQAGRTNRHAIGVFQRFSVRSEAEVSEQVGEKDPTGNEKRGVRLFGLPTEKEPPPAASLLNPLSIPVPVMRGSFSNLSSIQTDKSSFMGGKGATVTKSDDAASEKSSKESEASGVSGGDSRASSRIDRDSRLILTWKNTKDNPLHTDLKQALQIGLTIILITLIAIIFTLYRSFGLDKIIELLKTIILYESILIDIFHVAELVYFCRLPGQTSSICVGFESSKRLNELADSLTFAINRIGYMLDILPGYIDFKEPLTLKQFVSNDPTVATPFVVSNLHQATPRLVDSVVLLSTAQGSLTTNRDWLFIIENKEAYLTATVGLPKLVGNAVDLFFTTQHIGSLIYAGTFFAVSMV
jgi:PAS domain S-box-containing protein